MTTHQPVSHSRSLRQAVSRTAASRLRGCLRLGFLCAAFALCGAVLAQGFPGGGGGGMHGGHGAPPSDRAQHPSPQASRAPEPLEALLRSAHEMRQTLMLDAKQMESWGEMQADLRDALEKRRALVPKSGSATQVANPPLLFIQDLATGESALGAALDKLSRSMQAAFDTLDERQRKTALDSMTAALSSGASP